MTELEAVAKWVGNKAFEMLNPQLKKLLMDVIKENAHKNLKPGSDK